MRFGQREYRIALIVITIVLSLPLVMHIVNGMNSRMLADDYCFAANAISKGLTGTMTYYYYNWQGTFSSTAVQSAIALNGGVMVRWLPVFLVGGWWFGLFYLMWQLCEILGFQLPKLSALTLATLVLYTILEGTPIVFQSIYWTSGSVTYSVPLVLFTIWCGVVLHVIRKTISVYGMFFVAVITGIFAGLLAGFSPVFAVFEIGLLGLLLIGVWFWRPTRYGPIIILLLMSLVGAGMGTIIMIVAPGNSVRQAMFEKPPGLLTLIGINLKDVAYYIGIDLAIFSLVPQLTLLIVGGWLISRGMAGNSNIYKGVKRNPRRWLAGALGVVLLLLFGIFLPTSYNISGFPPARALIIPHLVMVGLVLTWGGIMSLSLKKSASGNGRVSPITIFTIVALLGIGPLLAAGKSVNLSPKLQTFAAEWDARDAMIRQAQNGSKQISVPSFSVDLADYVSVGAVEGGVVNCLTDYYHIQQLVVQK